VIAQYDEIVIVRQSSDPNLPQAGAISGGNRSTKTRRQDLSHE
jgi:hypothetical protein